MITFNSANSIAFSSTYIQDVNIKKKNDKDEYESYEGKLVELDMHDDRKKIKSICEKDEFRSFGNELYKTLYDNDYYNVSKKHCYALVENTEENLTDIDKDKVLGIYTLYELKNKRIPLSIPYFMTNGSYTNEYSSSDSEYKDIGKGMFKSIPKMYPDKAIYGYTAWSAMPFWEKMGMQHLSERRLVYVPESKKDEINLNLY